MSTSKSLIKNKVDHLYGGDCINVMTKKIKQNSIDLVFADPPYNVSGKKLSLVGSKTGGDFYKINENWDIMSNEKYDEFTCKWIELCTGLLKHHGSMYVCCTLHNIRSVLSALGHSQMKVTNIITWYKTNAMPSITKRTFTHSSEFLVYSTKNSKWIFNYEELKKINPERQKNGDLKQMRDVWFLPITQGKERLKSTGGRALHPAQKPEGLVTRAIVASTNKRDIVLDPFMGVGTTAVVAERLKRHWIGIEKNRDYRKYALVRIKKNR